MKYIIFRIKDEGGNYQQKVPIIFPNYMNHADVANAMLPVLTMGRPPTYKATVSSAGDVSIKTALPCTGRSITLRKSALPEDDRIIDTFDYMHGLV